jgi:hypothetical protein
VRLRDNRALQALRAVLPEQLLAASEVIRTLDYPVLLLHHESGPPSELVPLWVGEGFPRDVTDILDVINRGQAAYLATSQTRVLVSRRMSTGARRLLDEENISWADETGRARITAPPAVYIFRDAPAGLRSEISAANEPRWSESAGAVAETLLVNLDRSNPRSALTTNDGIEHDRLPGNAELAEETSWSVAQVSKVLQQFDTAGWTAKTGAERGTSAGRILADPGGMLSGWAGWHRSRRLQSAGAHAVVREPRELLDRIAWLGPGQWAVTGWLALDEVAPFATATPNVGCYLDTQTFDERLYDIMGELKLRPVTQGARITFLRAEPQVLRQSSIGPSGFRIVSPIRLYGDLLRQGVRGETAADHLREVTLAF